MYALTWKAIGNSKGAGGALRPKGRGGCGCGGEWMFTGTSYWRSKKESCACRMENTTQRCLPWLNKKKKVDSKTGLKLTYKFLVTGILLIFGQSCAKIIINHLFMHKMLLSHQEEDFKWIFEGRENHNYFWVIFLRCNDTTWKGWPNFFKLHVKSISILAICS